MFPHFLDGDILSFNRCGPYRRGDVIVYREPGGDRYIIHRIIRKTGDEIRTGGDNNSHPDPYPLSPCDIIGRITLNNRLGKEIRVRNGFAGYLVYLYHTRFQHLVFRILRVFHPLYLTASDPPILRNVCRRWGTLRSLVLIRPDGVIVVKVYLNNRCAAWIHEHEGIWHIRTPYRLFLDESDLPDMREAVKAALRAGAEKGDGDS